jgi:hypothetical protein
VAPGTSMISEGSVDPEQPVASAAPKHNASELPVPRAREYPAASTPEDLVPMIFSTTLETLTTTSDFR